jgi:transcriptional regulator with XRE-family HTH domain
MKYSNPSKKRVQTYGEDDPDFGLFSTKSIGTRIKEAREAAGISRADLAKTMQIQYQRITEWEEDYKAPLLKTCRLLGSYLNVEPEWLYSGDMRYQPFFDYMQHFNISDEHSALYKPSYDNMHQMVIDTITKFYYLDSKTQLTIMQEFRKAYRDSLISKDDLINDHEAATAEFYRLQGTTEEEMKKTYQAQKAEKKNKKPSKKDSKK